MQATPLFMTCSSLLFVATLKWGFFAAQAGGATETALAKSIALARKQAGVQHFLWSTLGNSKEVSGGEFSVPNWMQKFKGGASWSMIACSASRTVWDGGFHPVNSVLVNHPIQHLFQNNLKEKDL
jgi:hypothetical protein